MRKYCWHPFCSNHPFSLKGRRLVDENGHWEGETYFYLEFLSPEETDDARVTVVFTDEEALRLVEAIKEEYFRIYGREIEEVIEDGKK